MKAYFLHILFRFKHIVVFDIDEMFVPTENRKWREVMEELIREPQIIIPEKAVGFKNYRSQYYEEKERNEKQIPPDDISAWRLETYILLDNNISAERVLTHMMTTLMRDDEEQSYADGVSHGKSFINPAVVKTVRKKLSKT